MWTRGIAGLVFLVLGVVWIAQGTGALKGSFMTGHSSYAVLGGVVAAAGLGLMAWAARMRRHA